MRGVRLAVTAVRGQRGHAVLRVRPVPIAVVAGGGEHDQRRAAEAGQPLGLVEQRRHGGGFIHGVLPAAGTAGEGPVLARRRLGQRGPGGRREQAPDAEAGDAGQQGDRAGRAGVGRAGGGPVGAGGVEQDHPGDLLGVAVGVGHRVVAADGVPDQHVRAVLAGAGQQGVQIPGGGHPVLRFGGVLAPSLPGAVVGADPGGAGDGRRDPGPARREPTQPAHQHHGRAAGAGAVQVQPMAADVVEPAGHRVGALIGGQSDGLDGAADGRGGHHRHDGVEQPAAAAGGQGAAHPETPSTRRAPAAAAATPSRRRSAPGRPGSSPAAPHRWLRARRPEPRPTAGAGSSAGR